MPDQRARLIEAVAAGIRAVRARLTAVDGVDGAGKTHFADELARALTGAGTEVIRAADGFHHPPGVRYRRGRDSPEGFFRDSYDYGRLTRLLLDPLRPGGSGPYVRRVYDARAEAPIPPETEQAPEGAVLVLDGIFAHRDELAGYWDYSVYLHAPLDVSIPRGAQRGYGDPDPAAPSNARYVEGQRHYLAQCDPMRRATLVIDNTELERPAVIGRR